MPRRQAIAAGDFCRTGFATVKRLAFGQQVRSRGAMNGTVHATAAKQGPVGGIDNGIGAQRRNVGDADVKPRRTDCGTGKRSDVGDCRRHEPSLSRPSAGRMSSAPARPVAPRAISFQRALSVAADWVRPRPYPCCPSACQARPRQVGFGTALGPPSISIEPSDGAPSHLWADRGEVEPGSQTPRPAQRCDHRNQRIALSGTRLERSEIGAPGEFDALTDDEPLPCSAH